jgi:hypothetical protein
MSDFVVEYPRLARQLANLPSFHSQHTSRAKAAPEMDPRVISVTARNNRAR